MDDDRFSQSLGKIAKGAGIGFLGTFVGLAFGYISRIVIARFLEPSGYGLISLGFAVMSIAATLSLLGLSSGVRRYISFYKGKGDEGRLKGTILCALRMSFPLSLLISVIIYAFSDVISVRAFGDADMAPVLRIFSISIPFYVLTQIFVGVTIGFQNLRYKVYVIDLFQNVFKLVAIVALIKLGFGVLGAAFGWVLAIMAMPFIAFYLLEKNVYNILNSKVKAVSVNRELIAFSLPLILADVASLIMGWTDTLMLGYFSTATDVGIYNVALPTATLLMNVVVAFSMITLPVASELYAQNDTGGLKRIYSVVTKWVFLITLPITVYMIALSGPIIRVLFGSEYAYGSLALSILAVGFFIDASTGPVGPIIQTYGRTKVIMKCALIGAAINIILNVYLIPVYGIKGAAIATASTYISINIIYMIFVYYAYGMQPYNLGYFKPVFASGVAISAAYALIRYLPPESFVYLATLFLIFILIYLFLLIASKSFGEEDAEIMLKICDRLGIRSDWIGRII